MPKRKIILKGIPASPGWVQGKARIVKNYKDVAKLEYGNIVISSFLDPVSLAQIKEDLKVAGIITDKGGRTCHAAIIAREFKIPYIAGTQLATKRLKNNMEINMDGGNGTIYEVS